LIKLFCAISLDNMLGIPSHVLFF